MDRFQDDVSASPMARLSLYSPEPPSHGGGRTGRRAAAPPAPPAVSLNRRTTVRRRPREDDEENSTETRSSGVKGRGGTKSRTGQVRRSTEGLPGDAKLRRTASDEDDGVVGRGDGVVGAGAHDSVPIPFPAVQTKRSLDMHNSFAAGAAGAEFGRRHPTSAFARSPSKPTDSTVDALALGSGPAPPMPTRSPTIERGPAGVSDVSWSGAMDRGAIVFSPAASPVNTTLFQDDADGERSAPSCSRSASRGSRRSLASPQADLFGAGPCSPVGEGAVGAGESMRSASRTRSRTVSRSSASSFESGFNSTGLSGLGCVAEDTSFSDMDGPTLQRAKSPPILGRQTSQTSRMARSDSSLLTRQPSSQSRCSVDSVHTSCSSISGGTPIEDFDFFEDNGPPPLLPSAPGRGDLADLQCVDAGMMKRVVDGEFKDRMPSGYRIIDCRFAFEYDGGHIKGAENVYDPRLLERLFLENPELTGDRAPVLFFHCEFSQNRGPKMMRHLRNIDRDLNVERYPALFYPHIFLVEKGYKSVYHTVPDVCVPCMYQTMHDEHYCEQAKQSVKLVKAAYQHVNSDKTKRARRKGRRVSRSCDGVKL